MMLPIIKLIFPFGFLCNTSNAFAYRNTMNPSKHQLILFNPMNQNNYHNINKSLLIHLRGGGEDDGTDSAVNNNESIPSDSLEIEPTKAAAAITTSTLTSSIVSLAQKYNTLLDTKPIATKSITASLIFCLSDIVAQKIEKGDEDKEFDKKRTIAIMIVGLIYGRALHTWYGASK